MKPLNFRVLLGAATLAILPISTSCRDSRVITENVAGVVACGTESEAGLDVAGVTSSDTPLIVAKLKDGEIQVNYQGYAPDLGDGLGLHTRNGKDKNGKPFGEVTLDAGATLILVSHENETQPASSPKESYTFMTSNYGDVVVLIAANIPDVAGISGIAVKDGSVRANATQGFTAGLTATTPTRDQLLVETRSAGPNVTKSVDLRSGNSAVANVTTPQAGCSARITIAGVR